MLLVCDAATVMSHACAAERRTRWWPYLPTCSAGAWLVNASWFQCLCQSQLSHTRQPPHSLLQDKTEILLLPQGCRNDFRQHKKTEKVLLPVATPESVIPFTALY